MRQKNTERMTIVSFLVWSDNNFRPKTRLKISKILKNRISGINLGYCWKQIKDLLIKNFKINSFMTEAIII